MKVCKYCGKLIGFPLVCSHCENNFCEDCRLPETHNCDNFNSRTAIPLWKN